MQWWIGQVTDPDMESGVMHMKEYMPINGEEVYGFRCRVRIVGYHGNDTMIYQIKISISRIFFYHQTQRL